MPKLDIPFRLIKILDIGYVTAIYFVVAIILAKIFDEMYGPFNKAAEEKKGMLQRTVELILMMWVYGIVIYLIRNIVELIPSPFDGMYGFEHDRLAELKYAAVFTFIFLYFHSYFREKLMYYYNEFVIF